MSKQYLISEESLKELLEAAHKMAILEIDGVDNWEWCMESRKDFLVDCMLQLPWNEGRSVDDMLKVIDEEGYDINDLVDDQVAVFWEEHHEKCGRECQFKFKARPTTIPIDNH